MNSGKIVVYNKICFLSVIPIVWYHLKKWEIMYFSASNTVSKSNFFAHLCRVWDINEIKWADFDYTIHMQSHDQALDTIEDVYSKNFSHFRIIELMDSFFSSDKIPLVYKKELTLKMQSFYEVSNIINHISKKKRAAVLFHPDSGYNCIHKIIPDSICEEVCKCIDISWVSRFSLFIYEILRKVFLLIVLLFAPAGLILQKTRSIQRRKEKPDAYETGFRVYKNDWAFLFKYRTVDFLIDNKKITKENTLFCIETDISQDYLDQLHQKGYNVADIRNDLKVISWDFLLHTVLRKTSVFSVKAALMSISSPFYFIETTIGIIFNYLRWSWFNERYNIKNYVLYTDFDKYHVVRNILLNHCGTDVWYYIHSIHHGDLFEKKGDNFRIRHVFYSYLYYNYVVSWGNVCRMIYERSQNYIENYAHVGCLWSEHAIAASRKGENDPDYFRIEKFEKNNSGSKKVIGLFDTSFGRGVFIQLDDIISFFKGIYLLLEKNQDLSVIYKPKKEWDEMVSLLPEIVGDFKDILDKLQDHERFYSVGRLTDTCEVIAKSDLVISACFTSTTSEALGARKKALYYDSESRFRDCYFEKFPKMVAHGYAELEEYLNYWLYEITDAEFDDYLEKYVLGELDANLEGKGITKFRELLTGK